MTPLFVVVAKTRPWVEANMKETDLTYVKPGQKARVVLDIYPDVTWAAEVDTISPATGAEFRDPAAAERLRQLGQGRAAAAGARSPFAASGRATVARRHDRNGDGRQRSLSAAAWQR